MLTMQTLTKKDLTEALFDKIGLNKTESKKIVEVFFEEIARALERNDEVHISNFGNFELQSKKARPGRNPYSNKPVLIAPRRVVSFHASQNLSRGVKESLQEEAKKHAK